MIFISHRGNTNGVNPERENSLDYIQEALDKGFHVEIDLRIKDGQPHLGHDHADQPVPEQWLYERRERLWIHVKEYAALQWVLARPGLTYFCHESDAYTLVSNGKVWCHDWKNEMNEHCVIPLISKEQVLAYDKPRGRIHAVCSDFMLDCIEKFTRKVTFHVITPMNRPENIGPMSELLKTRNVHWHVITDASSTKEFNFNPDYNWIHHYKCPDPPSGTSNDSSGPDYPPGSDFWNRCNWAINWFLETQQVNDDDMYCFLNDDDAVEPEYFDKIYDALKQYNWEQKVAITSMERGHRTPSYINHWARHHPPDKLWAKPENIRVGGVGLEQIVAAGSVVKNLRFPYDVCGDGLFIIEAVKRHGAVIIPSATVWFNYFEPERWDKVPPYDR